MSNKKTGTRLARSISHLGAKLALGVASLLGTTSIALAHHPLGGATPATWTEGLLSGLGHPVIGFDHLAFIIVAAVFAWLLGRPVQAMLVFIVTSAVCVFATSKGLSLPGVEGAILFSLAAAGLGLMVATKAPAMLALGFMAFAGVVHGAAYGNAVVGAEATPLVAYLIGIVVAQSALAMGGVFAVRALGRRNPDRWLAGRLAGAMALGIALTYGVEQLESVLFSV